ncbi:hypothetical protein MTO96_049407 [Rhipicephalus appendiculatus]
MPNAWPRLRKKGESWKKANPENPAANCKRCACASWEGANRENSAANCKCCARAADRHSGHTACSIYYTKFYVVHDRTDAAKFNRP